MRCNHNIDIHTHTHNMDNSSSKFYNFSISIFMEAMGWPRGTCILHSMGKTAQICARSFTSFHLLSRPLLVFSPVSGDNETAILLNSYITGLGHHLKLGITTLHCWEAKNDAQKREVDHYVPFVGGWISLLQSPAKLPTSVDSNQSFDPQQIL